MKGENETENWAEEINAPLLNWEHMPNLKINTRLAQLHGTCKNYSVGQVALLYGSMKLSSIGHKA